MNGIVSYGAYVPGYKIETGEIASVWGADGSAWAKNLNVYSKSVPGPDEDVITIAVEATRQAMKRAKITGDDIEAVYTGSESHPYAVKPTSTIVAEAINATPNLTAADFEFACKAGTAAIQTCLGMVGHKQIKNGIAIGVDTSQGAPGDALEYSASAGGGALIIGRENVIANINHTTSYTTDTPDFWRREGQKYPRHGGRFTGKPAFFKHVMNCGIMMMEKAGTKPEDYDYIVTHQPNGKFPIRAAKSLGFTKEQFEKVNGYSNGYWNWGMEDDDLFWRVKKYGMADETYMEEFSPVTKNVLVLNGTDDYVKIKSSLSLKNFVNKSFSGSGSITLYILSLAFF